jgi:hypothetical protein
MLAWLLLAASAPSVPIAGPGVIFRDEAREIEVRYAFTPTGVEFSSSMPAGWSFTIAIDGDQNGLWGNGPGFEAASRGPTADHKFGQDARNGVFCAQIILASDPSDPSQYFISSECNGFRSHGHVEATQLDDRGRSTITLKVPPAEVFGTNAEAHLQVCIWDTRRSTCHFSPAQPFILRRSAPNPE